MPFMSNYRYWLERVIDEAASGNPFYVPKRVGYALRKRLVDRRFSSVDLDRTGRCFNTNIPEDPVRLMEYFRRRRSPTFHFQTEDIDGFVSRIPCEIKAKTVAAADEVLRRRFTFRGFDPIMVHPIDWRTAPNNHLGWQRDLNRHFYFTQLGFAYWYTKDSRYAETFIDLSTSWIDQNANRLGELTWDDPFEVGARINGWIWAYFLFLGCPQWDANRHDQFLKALGRLTEYLYQVIEYHRPGNHILLEAKALSLCGGLFPEFKRARSWEAKGLRILKREIRSQICPDGVHAERSTMYHRIVAGELAEILLFALRNNTPELGDLGVAVSRMADFEEWITTEEGSLPLFGDAYSNDTYIRFSAPAIVAALMNDGEIPSSVPGVTDQSYWAAGTRPLKRKHTSLPHSSEEQASKAFGDGGYFVSRSYGAKRSSVLVWDCGPVGYGTNYYHSHLDTLSFSLALNGLPILVDPGTDENDRDKRRYLCGTSAHNTVQIDGQDQSIRTENDRIRRPARARLVFWGSLPECDVMIGSHDGYRRLRDSAIHTRTIISMRTHYWLIFDRIDGRDYHTAEQRFHLAPGATVQRTRDHERLRIERGEIDLEFVSMPFITDGEERASQRTEIQTGLAELECGRCEHISVIETTRKGLSPFSIGAFLCPRTQTNDSVSVQVSDSGLSSGFQGTEIQGPGFRDRIFFRLGDQARGKFLDGWETDGRIVILRYGKNDVVISAFVVDASTLVRDSREYTDSTSHSARLQKIVFTEHEPFS